MHVNLTRKTQQVYGGGHKSKGRIVTFVRDAALQGQGDYEVGFVIDETDMTLYRRGHAGAEYRVTDTALAIDKVTPLNRK
jgi:hypothetical protein